MRTFISILSGCVLWIAVPSNAQESTLPPASRTVGARISRADSTAPAAVPPAGQPAATANTNGRGGTSPTSATSAAGSPAATPSADAASSTGAQVARVTKGSGVLPNNHGQIWREYDLSPFTARSKGVDKPEQAVIDWILRETGTDLWFSEPLGILNADKNTLRVYHTPEMQRLIAGIVDRFVHSGSESLGLGVRMATIASPNWRSRAYGWMRPVEVKSPGVEAWLVSKENAAFLLADLARRADYREHNSPNLMIGNGQTHTVSRLRPRSYVRSVRPRDTVVAGYDSEMGQIDEGYSLQISPLFSLDGRNIDAMIKCQIDQVEKLVPVTIDLPGFGGQWQRAQIQVPQVVSWRLSERFRWPADQVLMVSCGVVASPSGDNAGGPLAFVNALTTSSGNRADALLFIDCQTRAPGATTTEEPRATANGGTTYRGRY